MSFLAPTDRLAAAYLAAAQLASARSRALNAIADRIAETPRMELNTSCSSQLVVAMRSGGGLGTKVRTRRD